MGKALGCRFSIEGIQMSKNLVKRCSMVLVIKEMEIKTTKIALVSSRKVRIIVTIPNDGEDVKEPDYSFISGKDVKC
jgi:hypothetical protein